MTIRALSAEHLDSPHREQFALDVLMGLSGKPRTLPSKYFYDDRGSELFQQIMALPEYYPTDCEREIFVRRGSEIARTLRGESLEVVELGAGDGTKTRLLIEALQDARVEVHYVAVDISRGALQTLSDNVATWFGDLGFLGLESEYFTALRWLGQQPDSGRKLVLFLGSNIGNFNGPQARVFMRTLWNALEAGDHVLTGFDLKKDIDVMLDAYNDPQGVTRAFNLNLLERINRELGADFDHEAFEHFGTYNVFTGAMESYLVSLAHQSVYVQALNKSFEFVPFEPILVEYSFKFLVEDIENLAAETGFAQVATFSDDKGWFADALWKVEKEGA